MSASGLPIIFLLVGAIATAVIVLIVIRRQRASREANGVTARVCGQDIEPDLAPPGNNAEATGSLQAVPVGGAKVELVATEQDEPPRDSAATSFDAVPPSDARANRTAVVPIQGGPEPRLRTSEKLSPSETQKRPRAAEDEASASPEPPLSGSLQQIAEKPFAKENHFPLTEGALAVPDGMDDREAGGLASAAVERQADPPPEEPPLPEDDRAGDDGTRAEPALAPVEVDEPISAVAPEETAPVTERPPEKPAPERHPSERPRSAARHQDRRGGRRTASERTPENQPVEPASPPVLRQAEAKLRISVDWNRRSARLSIVLLRPEGFPELIEVDIGGLQSVDAFFEGGRYDDIDIDWTPGFLATELRFTDADGHLEWLRSARPFHLFAATPGEPDLVSVSAVRVGVEHTVICREGDIDAVQAAATAAGSRSPTTIQGWQGIPDGWAILTGYTPQHALQSLTDSRLRPLDPGAGTEISLDGGIEIRSGTYSEGHLPHIVIEPLPPGCAVSIGGQPASQADDGSWIAPGWDAPGDHLVDVVPGPSLTYRVLADPGGVGGWAVWDAHPDLVSARGNAPWAQAAICGAHVYATGDRTVVACETRPSVVALGARAHVQALARRPDVPAAIAVLPFMPAFLVASSGLRRHQGTIFWLNGAPSGRALRMQRIPDLTWVSVVRATAARRFAVYPDTDAAKSAWRSAAASARRTRRRKA